MKIIFNLVNVGLGNNGGSQSIIKSANTLVDLGCDVTIIDSGRNQYTWDVLKANHKIIKSQKDIPDADIIIGTGYRSWKHILNLPNRCGKKFIWVRGFETWNAPESELVKILKNKDIIKIVNSIGLSDKLISYNIDSFLIRPGNNFEDFQPLNIRDTNKIILGGLYNQGTKRVNKRTNWILDAYPEIKYKYSGTKLYMFGTDGIPHYPIDKYIKDPNKIEKNKLLNKVNIWLAPTCNEGLHVAPQEFMLTKGFVVGTNASMSGMNDYLEDEVTGFVSDNNFKSFVASIERAIHSFHKTKIGENARNIILEMGNREDNMNKMLNLFRTI